MVSSTSDSGYRQCSLSVMDNLSDPGIAFDEKGISNYYYQYKEAERLLVFDGLEGERRLSVLVEKIRESGKGKPYDCIAGVSGGVDSTYVALQAKRLGLRPLIVHFDNGWNSELSVKNIDNIIGKLGFDLFTLVVDWNEFRDLQLAYLRASVVDIEAITDHAILATMYTLARKHNIHYILSGSNIVTEQVLPSYWIWSKADQRNIKDIHRQFGTVPLKTYPFLRSQLRQFYWGANRVEFVSILNYLPYDKKEVKKVIGHELDWRDYGGKHYESIFTRFYQGYILPRKFNIDKRKAHLSNLIFSGQITKEEAVQELQKPMYDQVQLNSDYEFVLKKLELSRDQFEAIIALPRREHNDFDYEKSTIWETYPLLFPFKGVWTNLKRKYLRGHIF